jgi:hypothetical protein
VDGGLPYDQAQAIADDWWAIDPHECAARQWEAYASTLPPALPVAQVNTGVQSISYGGATPGGALGEALARAAWHRTFVTGQLTSVPLRAGRAARWPV